MGGCGQAGSSWRGGGAEAQPELPCFPLSLRAERTELEFHVQLKFACYCLQQPGLQNPREQRGADQTGFLDLQLPDSRPAFSEGISVLGIVPISNFARRSQPAGCN